MNEVIVVIGPAQIGQAIARRVGVGEARHPGRPSRGELAFLSGLIYCIARYYPCIVLLIPETTFTEGLERACGVRILPPAPLTSSAENISNVDRGASTRFSAHPKFERDALSCWSKVAESILYATCGNAQFL